MSVYQDIRTYKKVTQPPYSTRRPDSISTVITEDGSRLGIRKWNGTVYLVTRDGRQPVSVTDATPDNIEKALKRILDSTEISDDIKKELVVLLLDDIVNDFMKQRNLVLNADCMD